MKHKLGLTQDNFLNENWFKPDMSAKILLFKSNTSIKMRVSMLSSVVENACQSTFYVNKYFEKALNLVVPSSK